MGRAERANPFGGGRQVKEYRVTVRVTLNEIESQLVAGPGGQKGVGEKVASVQITESAGAGPTPAEALKDAMGKGVGAYLEGLSEASDKLALLAPGRGEGEGH